MCIAEVLRALEPTCVSENVWRLFTAGKCSVEMQLTELMRNNGFSDKKLTLYPMLRRSKTADKH